MESERIVELLTSISHVKKPVETVGKGDIDLSELVALRSIHETQQARKGVRRPTGTENLTTDPDPVQVVEVSRPTSARQEIVQKFYQLLRDADAEGERIGTGLHRSYVWSGSNGNALNAAKAAEARTKTVRIVPCWTGLAPTISISLKVTAARKSIFGSIDIKGQPSSAALLVCGGVSKLYNLICAGENVGENGTSWGFVYLKDRVLLARGMCTDKSHRPTNTSNSSCNLLENRG